VAAVEVSPLWHHPMSAIFLRLKRCSWRDTLSLQRKQPTLVGPTGEP
jgi:hypothetical protein